jgi:hypothetical protein
MYKAVNTLFYLNKNAEIGEVANPCSMFVLTYCILSPLSSTHGSSFKLLDAK